MKILYYTTYNTTGNKQKSIYLLPSISVHFIYRELQSQQYKRMIVDFRFLIFRIYTVYKH